MSGEINRGLRADRDGKTQSKHCAESSHDRTIDTRDCATMKRVLRLSGANGRPLRAGETRYFSADAGTEFCAAFGSASRRSHLCDRNCCRISSSVPEKWVWQYSHTPLSGVICGNRSFLLLIISYSVPHTSTATASQHERPAKPAQFAARVASSRRNAGTHLTCDNGCSRRRAPF